jgi:hypothetical protein
MAEYPAPMEANVVPELKQLALDACLISEQTTV